ncbi:MAG: response regulator [Flavobacterium sp.]
MINILIVDDHKMVREGFKLLLENHPKMGVPNFASSGKEAIEKISVLQPDIVLMDINMPELNGIDATKIIINKYPQTKIIALTMHKEISIVKLMLNNGAKGYLLKNAGLDELVEAIEAVISGKQYLDNSISESFFNSLTNSKNETNSDFIPKFSRREKEILQLIANEFTTQEIAEKLCISFGTVETHRRNMLIKSGARNTVGLVKIAIELDLI